MRSVKQYASQSFAFFISLLVMGMMCSCKKSNDSPGGFAPPPVTPAIPPPSDPVPFPINGKTFLALGDSYTIGQSVNKDERFPYQAARKLIAGGMAVKEPQIIATTGWTTGNLKDALDLNPPATDYDMVTLLIGVNNQYQGRSQAEYRIQFTELLTRAVQYAAGNKNHVFVLSIPDYSVTPFASGSDKARIALEIDQFNAINKEITLAAGIKYIDITPVSRQGATDATLQAPDGLHPSGKQYGMWVELLAPVIKAAF